VNAIFALMFCTSAFYLFPLIYQYRKKGIWADDMNRMLFGFALMSIGVAIRIGPWIPWRAFLAEGDQVGADWYRGYSWLWTWGGVIFALAGLLIITYPALQRQFGKWALLVAGLFVTNFYIIGLFAAEYLV
jgi:hypothetical protein